MLSQPDPKLLDAIRENALARSVTDKQLEAMRLNFESFVLLQNNEQAEALRVAAHNTLDTQLDLIGQSAELIRRLTLAR
jgi:hypothetical protein